MEDSASLFGEEDLGEEGIANMSIDDARLGLTPPPLPGSQSGSDSETGSDSDSEDSEGDGLKKITGKRPRVSTGSTKQRTPKKSKNFKSSEYVATSDDDDDEENDDDMEQVA